MPRIGPGLVALERAVLALKAEHRLRADVGQLHACALDPGAPDVVGANDPQLAHTLLVEHHLHRAERAEAVVALAHADPAGSERLFADRDLGAVQMRRLGGWLGQESELAFVDVGRFELGAAGEGEEQQDDEYDAVHGLAPPRRESSGPAEESLQSVEGGIEQGHGGGEREP